MVTLNVLLPSVILWKNVRGGPLDVEGGWRNKPKKNLHHQVLAKKKCAPWSLIKKNISPINSLTQKIFAPWLQSKNNNFCLATLGINPPSFECFRQNLFSTNMVWQKKNWHHNICCKQKISTSMVWQKKNVHYQCVAKIIFPPEQILHPPPLNI